MTARLLDAIRHPETAIDEAAALLRAGRLVAFPTETVYGLGANALDADAVRRIFEAKGRPSVNPLIVHLADAAQAPRVVAEWPERAARLAEAFWPGPLTLVLPKRDVVPDAVTAGLPAVGVRVPAHPIARALIAAANTPLAAPSANRYTELSPTRAAHVLKSLGDRIDAVLDGGDAHVGIESAVLDLTGERAVLLRPGALDAARIAAVLGEPLDVVEGAVDESVPRVSPGLSPRHYAPRATLRAFDADARDAVRVLVARRDATATIGALLLTPWGAPPSPDVVIDMPNDAAAYASALYAALHALDDAGCDTILVERPPATDASWAGVRDRLARAEA